MLRIAFIQDETDLLLIDVQVIEFIEPSLCPSDNCTINLLFPVTSSKALFWKSLYWGFTFLFTKGYS